MLDINRSSSFEFKYAKTWSMRGTRRGYSNMHKIFFYLKFQGFKDVRETIYEKKRGCCIYVKFVCGE